MSPRFGFKLRLSHCPLRFVSGHERVVPYIGVIQLVQPVRKYLGILLIVLGLILNFRVASLYRMTGSDFYQDYVAASALISGESWYKTFPHPHPPFAVFFHVPFAIFELGTAFMLFAAVSIVATAVMCGVLSKLFNVERHFLLIFSLILLWPEYQGIMGLGSMSAIISLCVVLFIYALHNKNYSLAGFFLAFATSMKLYPAPLILIPLFYREWRVITSFIISIFCLHLPVLLLSGTVPFYEWKEIGIPFALKFLDCPLNISLLGYFERLFGPPGGFREPVTFLPTFIEYAKILIPFSGLGVICVASYIYSKGKHSELEAISFALPVLLFSQAITWGHYLLLVIVPFFWVSIHRSRMPKQRRRITDCLFVVAIFLLLGLEVSTRRVEANWINYFRTLPLYFEGLAPMLGLMLLTALVILTRSENH